MWHACYHFNIFIIIIFNIQTIISFKVFLNVKRPIINVMDHLLKIYKPLLKN